MGLCHSVQCCSKYLLKDLDMEGKLEGRRGLIAGINHMGWLLEIYDKDGTDLYPELIEKFNIQLDEYPRRCVEQVKKWKEHKEKILNNGEVTHTRTTEYASYIMEAITTGVPYKIGGNVINNGAIENLPNDACVEVPCMVDNMGIHPTQVGKLPTQLAAMNMTNINVQLLAIEAAVTKDRKKIYQAAMLDPHTAAELSIDDIVAMCDEMIEAQGSYMECY